MSEHIVHTAVLEDCFNFMEVSDEICNDFKEIAKIYRDFAQLGSVTISGDTFSFKLMEQYKKEWKDRKPEDMLEQKLAFVLGWVSHRAADRQMKPVWRLGPIQEISKEVGLKPTDCSIYHEACIFKEYYSKDLVLRNAIITEDLKAETTNAGLDYEGMVQLSRTLVKRTLIEMHTFIPDADDVNGWLEKLFTRQQQLKVDVERYTKAVVNPDPEKVQMYVTNINFFNSKDPIIVLCKKLRKGEKVDEIEVKRALDTKIGSHYAQAVGMGFGYFKAASDYFTKDISLEELKDRLDIGKKGPENISV